MTMASNLTGTGPSASRLLVVAILILVALAGVPYLGDSC
jgi:hypothetical protein